MQFPIGNPFTYPTNTWQELNWDPAVGSDDFYHFCSNVTNSKASKNVTAVDSALSKYTNGEKWTGLGNWAKYVKEVVIPTCPAGESLNSNQCFGTQNATYWANTALDPTGTRPYLWQSCTELCVVLTLLACSAADPAMSAAESTPVRVNIADMSAPSDFLPPIAEAAPKGRRSLISRVLQPDHTQQWCKWAFPAGKYASIPSSPDTARWNKYGGFSFAADRLAFVDGGEDPWQYV